MTTVGAPDVFPEGEVQPSLILHPNSTHHTTWHLRMGPDGRTIVLDSCGTRLIFGKEDIDGTVQGRQEEGGAGEEAHQ
jgi:hypothetical protein